MRSDPAVLPYLYVICNGNLSDLAPDVAATGREGGQPAPAIKKRAIDDCYYATNSNIYILSVGQGALDILLAL